MDKFVWVRFRLKTKSNSSFIRKLLKLLIVMIILSYSLPENHALKRTTVEIWEGISMEFGPS